MSAIKLLMIDNYDSFTYNIVQYFGELGAQVDVFRAGLRITDLGHRSSIASIENPDESKKSRHFRKCMDF